MLREVHHELQVHRWKSTKDATRPPAMQRHFPTRLALTKAERDAEAAANAPQYDVTPIAEMADFLGWKRPKSA